MEGKTKTGVVIPPLTNIMAPVNPSNKPDEPVIPLSILDAPSQRAYALVVYAILFAWRLYDYSILIKDDADSLFYFMKWATIDGLFIYGLPALRIPWLEWSGTTAMVLFMLHAVLDWLMMFRVSIPIETWLIGLTKILYDRELAVSERKVKPADIIRHSSLILGKQTVHILPDGNAMLNPDHTPYCLDSHRTAVRIPIRITQTNPILIELTRLDLNSNDNETITIPARQVKALVKQADRLLPKHDPTEPRDLQYQVKHTGLYKLSRVLDESGLDVQKTASDTLVVPCPSASIKPVDPHKCKGDLSNLVLQVVGTPPLKIKYSRTVNDKDKAFSFQSIQPDILVSPLKPQASAGALVPQHYSDLSWARPHRIEVPLNESLSSLGSWLYSIDEVYDAIGNSVNYTHPTHDGIQLSAARNHLEQAYVVHARPSASLETHKKSPCRLKVARGTTARLPVKVETAGREKDGPYTLWYKHTPLEKAQPNGEHAKDANIEAVKVRGPGDRPEVKSPGLYTLHAVSSTFCDGEILEPASCVLTNPPEPNMSVASKNIYDNCAGNPIGLLVDLDLTGTPPFQVHYDSRNTHEGRVQSHSIQIDGLRHQLEFKPSEAGHYVYTFKTIKDRVYDTRGLSGDNLVLEQDVKPPASAFLFDAGYRRQVCIGELVHFSVVLQGESPWSLEYEVIHGGKRKKYKIDKIEEGFYTIVTDKLLDGGEYTVALVSVQDKSGCKIFLKDEAEIDVRQQRPKVSFGPYEGKHSVMILEGQKVALPLRLTGQSPWTVLYRSKNETSVSGVQKVEPQKQNDEIIVDRPGQYELIEVRDAICPGTVDEAANKFEVQWIQRPKMRVTESAVVRLEGGKYIKKEVCEGDEDTVELLLTGTPPYLVKYHQRLTPDRGSQNMINKKFTAGLSVASIRMETNHAGKVEYEFYELDDHLYEHDPRKHKAMTIQQRVNPKPSAEFAVPGKTYKYCKEEKEGDEVIPIKLHGTAPFYLEIGIKQHNTPQPEIIRIPNIESSRYDFRLPHRVLALGSHTVSVRKVRDAHGCQQRFERNAPHVLVQVADPPSISPLETRADYCVGERISYTLSGTPPFTVEYTFQGAKREAKSSTTTFRRIAERAGEYTITAVADSASECKAKTQITKMIHEMPSVRISKGKETRVDIHEGGTADLRFDFSGTPPFEFTYTRSENPGKSHKRPRVLETKQDISHEHVKIIRASEEGTYEAVAIKDRYCAFSTQPTDVKKGQKLLQL